MCRSNTIARTITGAMIITSAEMFRHGGPRVAFCATTRIGMDCVSTRSANQSVCR